MHVKRFEAVDMPEALRLVKHALGPDAIILSTRQIKKGGGAFGMFSRSFVEVTAAVERETVEEPQSRSMPIPPQPVAPGLMSSGRGGVAETLEMSRMLDPLQRDVEQMKELLQQLAMKERLSPPVNLNGFEREFTAVKRMVEVLVRKQQDSAAPLLVSTLIPCYQRLIASGMDETLARHLAEKAQNSLEPDKLADAQTVQEQVANLVVKTTPTSGPLRATPGNQIVAAFVGPTGVGKTTTIAKLAAHYALSEKRKVALLTLDTYRLAAVEQLRLFAKIIGLSVEIVLTAAELEQALDRHQGTEVVLIDTAGRSQRDALQMAELSTFFTDNQRVEVHLVLSATASALNLSDTVTRFKPLGVKTLVFTKLDESTSFGVLLSTAHHAHLPLSYFTTGQRVPEDIEVATPERVVDLILNVSQWHTDACATERG